MESTCIFITDAYYTSFYLRTADGSGDNMELRELDYYTERSGMRELTTVECPFHRDGLIRCLSSQSWNAN